MEKYIATVVTAFRDTEVDAFAKCLDSMTAQTAGFARIEWIIVLHNTDKVRSDKVRLMTSRYDNVRVKVLSDYSVTASAPRNLGIELASAPYVMFLDPDDTLTLQCIRSAVTQITESGAQMAWFRKEYVTDEQGEAGKAEIVLWNQTYEEIVFEKDEIPNNEKLLGGECGTVTGKLFEREFLNRNAIRFSEQLTDSEETLFILECCGMADRVCCLPQLIGYRSSGKSPAQINDAPALISAATGYQKIFDTGISYGLYMTDIMNILCFRLSQRILASSRLSTRDRQKIKDILASYLENLEPRRVSKLCSQKMAKEMYEFPRAVILDPESYTGDYEQFTLLPTEGGQRYTGYQLLLRDILDVNGSTDFGERYGFRAIHTLTEFQQKVPVSGYDVYAPLLTLQTNIGESGILTSDRVRSYVLDLGRLDNPRVIPCTERQIEPLGSLLRGAVTGEKTFLMLESYPRRYRYSDAAVVNTVYGSMLSDIFADEGLSVYAKRAMFTAPAELLFPDTVSDMTYLRLLFALSERFTKQIIAPNTWELWETCRFLEKNWKDLCADIESGSPDHFNEFITDEYREIIRNSLIPDPGRASELAEIFGKGFDTPVLPKIWKKLSKVYACSDGTYEIYTAGLARFLGDLPVTNGVFTASAALIGTETGIPGYYRLEAKNAYTEFAPTDGRAEAVSPHEVVPGKDYNLLITTYSGLYRYRLSDVVRIERTDGGVPVFSYRYSENETVMLGEYGVTDEQIRGAVLELMRSGCSITDYAYLRDDETGGLNVLLEITDDDVASLNREELAAQLETLLKERSPQYREAAASGTVRPVSIAFIEQETQLFYRDILMNRIDRPSDLIKPVRYINSPVKESFFGSRIIK